MLEPGSGSVGRRDLVFGTNKPQPAKTTAYMGAGGSGELKRNLLTGLWHRPTDAARAVPRLGRHLEARCGVACAAVTGW